MDQIAFERMPETRYPVEARTERQARINLAALYRLMAHFRMTDIIYTHISARVPGTENEFLINPYGVMFDQVTASCLVKIDIDGNILEDATGLGVNVGGFAIHAAVHRARPEVECVLHAHTLATMTVSVQPDGLLPICQHAMFLDGRIAYHPYSGFFETREKCDALARSLGDKSIMMLRNHGPVVAGRTIPQTFNLMYYLERACQVQVATQSTGVPYILPDPSDVRVVAEVFAAPGATVVAREWSALMQTLDRIDPSYAS